MLKLMTANCDGEVINYEWETLSDFLAAMDNDSDDIPMFDDELISVSCKDYPHIRKMKFDDVYDLYDYLSGEKFAYED